MSFNGQSTTLAWNASAAAVKTALNLLSTINGAVASVTRTAIATASQTSAPAVGIPATGYIYTITFGGDLAGTNVPLFASGTSGTSAAASTVAYGGIDNLVDSGATLELDSSTNTTFPTGFTVPAVQTLTLNGNGVGGVGALNNIFGNNTWAGLVTLATASSIGAVGPPPAAQSDTSLTLSGGVAGGAGDPLTKVGNGTLIFPAGSSNTFTGGTIIAVGDVQVDGVIGNVLLDGGTLSGLGTVGTITGLPGAGGTIFPGDNFPTALSFGTLTSNGGVSLDPSDQVFVDLGPSSPFNDLLDVMNGSINLNGASLQATADPSIPIGPVTPPLTIIDVTDNGTIPTDIVDGVNPVIPADLFAGPATAPVAGGLTATYVNINGVKFIVDYFVNEVVVTRALWNSTLTLSSSLTIPPTVVYGQAETLLATFHPEALAPTPTGTVTFNITGPGGSLISYQVAINAAGVADFDPTAAIPAGTGAPFSVGIWTVNSATYSNPNFNPVSATPSPFSITVNQANTATTIASSANPSLFGQQVTFTATVKSTILPAFQAVGTLTPSGTVTFKDGAATLGTAVLSGGTATFQISALAVAGHSITVFYPGDTNYNPSTSSILTQTVNKAGTTATLVSSVNPSLFGQSVTFTATETSATGAVIPSGETITFKDGATVIGTGTLNASDQASFTTSTLSVAGHSIIAVYNGDSSFLGNTSPTVPQTVNKAPTTTLLTSSSNPSSFGQSVKFTASVSSSTGAVIPSGETITFKDGASVLGTGALNGSDQASFTISTLAVAGHSITAVYGGDGSFVTSTSTVLTQTVNQAATTTIVSSSFNPSSFGQSVTFQGSVSSQYGVAIPNGETVTFLDGATTLGTGVLNGGTTTFQTSTLALNGHSITVFYPGDGNFLPSTSTVLSQTVNQATTTIALSSSLNPAAFGQLVTFTANVSSNTGAAIPSGETVTFLDGGKTIGTGTLSGGTTTFQTSTLSVAGHFITAYYPGDTDFLTSTLSILTETVNQAATSTSLSTTTNPSAFGQSVTFTATVTAAVAIPNGETVTFKDGATVIGTVRSAVERLRSRFRRSRWPATPSRRSTPATSTSSRAPCRP